VTSNLDWAAAGQECPSLHTDAHLLIINDADEQSAIAGMLDSTDGPFILNVLLYCFALLQ